jgi:hypothetical protein
LAFSLAPRFQSIRGLISCASCSVLVPVSNPLQSMRSTAGKRPRERPIRSSKPETADQP